MNLLEIFIFNVICIISLIGKFLPTISESLFYLLIQTDLIKSFTLNLCIPFASLFCTKFKANIYFHTLLFRILSLDKEYNRFQLRFLPS